MNFTCPGLKIAQETGWAAARSESSGPARGRIDSARDPAVLDILAGALAATGPFDRAKKTTQAALDLEKSASNLEIAQQIELRLEGDQQERLHVDRKSES